ncbi:MAG: YebC/PmpR family DNA-binding transcriptional regulator [Myxococcaceae bacterium]
MSGHNRWSKIKRYKAVVGAAKGKLYSKLIKEITVAAKAGGGDLNGNHRLRAAVGLARDANMPADTITRAIKKGTGELEGNAIEEVLYEGYGPGGVALLIECMTDNMNRTASDVRSILDRWGGNLGTPGSVKFVFTKMGTIQVKPGSTEDQVTEQAIEAGAEDVVSHGADGFEVRTHPEDLHHVAIALEKAKLSLGEQKWSYLPTTTVKVEGEHASKLLKLLEALDDNDDVQNVHANFEMDEKLMESLA